MRKKRTVRFKDLPDTPNAFALWIHRRELDTRGDVARLLGITRNYMDALRFRGRSPSLTIAVRIEALSDGEVTCKSWLA